jgi:hypothetical protein
MSELLSKEVEAIILQNTDGFVIGPPGQQGNMRVAMRSVLLLATKETCQLCAYEIPIIEGTPYHAVLKRGKEQPILCSAAPIHKMMRGDK